MSWAQRDRVARALAALALGLAPLLYTATAAAQRPAHPGRVGFLTERSARPAEAIARDYMARHLPELGLDPGDLDESVVSDRYVSPQTGTTHLYLRQRLDGLDVIGGVAVAAVRGDGRLVTLRHRFVRNLRARAQLRTPLLAPEEAISSALTDLGLVASEPLERETGPLGPARRGRFSRAGASVDPIPVRLAWLVPHSADPAAPAVGAPAEPRLVWTLLIRPPGGLHWWSVKVDARTGDVLAKYDRVRNDRYRVFAFPLESPREGPRTLEVDPAEASASPLAWHDDDGVAGADWTVTRGNAAIAQEDVDSNNVGGLQPSGGAGLDFDFPLDLAFAPGTYINATIANLFYWTSRLHDVFFHYGFDEPSGNFQETHYGTGGLDGDPVIADAQDGGGFSNANFATPPDGQAPRMQMFLWNDSAGPSVHVTLPESIGGAYPAGTAEFGDPVTGDPVAADVVQALDAADANSPSTTNACTALTNPGVVGGNLALIDRGDCLFVDKVRNAQAAGAVGAIIVNNVADGIVNMAGSDPNITIPSLFLSQVDGAVLEAELAGGLEGSLVVIQTRASSLDGSVITHEYGHGVSTRLTGGPSTVDCLESAQPDGMNEGWSDFFALALLAQPGDTGPGPRGFGTYLLAEPRSGAGIRNFRYSTDLAVNPQTYTDITFTNRPHGIGEIWASALWDMYWNLVAIHGFDPDPVTGSGGNNLAVQLVLDAQKLQACNPSFLDGRDAILLADLNLTGARNLCPIWDAFAHRGMGASATDGGSANSVTPNEAFDVPAVECTPTDSDSDEIPDDGDFSGVVGDAPCLAGETLWCDDSCPFVANPGQEDSGGIATSLADGIGDACQCGDNSHNGIVNLTDVGRLNQWLSTGGTLPGNFDTEQCDVGGSASCNLTDVARLKEGLSDPGAGAIRQGCAPALP